MNALQDRIRGSLIGGAIGDALGYPVEFMSRKNILHKYGNMGVRRFQEFDRNGRAVVSDDTQMTLFTANGLLFGITRLCTHGGLGAGMKDFVCYAYMDWLQTQYGIEDYNAYHYCWIRDIVELNVQRAPGNTCMSALRAIKNHEEVHNDSKGCGGVMRVAPVGLMAAADEQVMVKGWNGKDVPRREWTEKEVVRLGGDCAEITHKHPLGYLPSAFMADLIYYILMYDEPITFNVLENFLGAVYADVKQEYTLEREQKALDELWALIEKAVSQAGDVTALDESTIPRLGEGWTGDEALAIAIYCTLKHLDSFEDALAAAVNHDGDSDSTGAICGNLMGAIIGYNAIPEHFKQKLELRELIIDLADDIVKGCTIGEYHAAQTPDEKQWEKRYVKIEPVSRQRFKSVLSFLNTEYHIMPEAIRSMEIKSLIHKIKLTEDRVEKCLLGHKLAIKVFDTSTFKPFEVLPYRPLCNEPQDCFLIKDFLPAYYYGYEDSKYSPRHNKRIFKLRADCFRGTNPVIGVRNDGSWLVRNTPEAGLDYYEDKQTDKYGIWQFFRINTGTIDEEGFAVFTNDLEKEFSVEIAHLTEDGTLHRIYHLHY